MHKHMCRAPLGPQQERVPTGAPGTGGRGATTALPTAIGNQHTRSKIIGAGPKCLAPLPHIRPKGGPNQKTDKLTVLCDWIMQRVPKLSPTSRRLVSWTDRWDTLLPSSTPPPLPTGALGGQGLLWAAPQRTLLGGNGGGEESVGHGQEPARCGSVAFSPTSGNCQFIRGLKKNISHYQKL